MKGSPLFSAAVIRRQVFGDDGVSVCLKSTDAELVEFRRLVEAHWIGHLGKQYPANLVEAFRAAGMAHYHRLADKVNHAALWPKTARLLSEAAVTRIRRMSFMGALEEAFGEFTISNEEEVFPEEIYWRIIRPGAPSDIGPIHADAWFWELGHGKMPAGSVRIKVWIPLWCEPGMSGLKVLPGSHKRNWAYHGEMRDGFTKPLIDFDPATLPMKLLATEPGTLAIFHDRLLHGGALNCGQMTRISAEFTILGSRSNLKKTSITSV